MAYDAPCVNWRDYSFEFTKYVVNDMKKATAFDLCFTNPLSPVLHALEMDEYNRSSNAFVVIKLMPIFEANPTLWSAVPLLCRIPEGTDFKESLQYWHSQCPEEHKNSVEKIANVFSLSVKEKSPC